MNKILNDEIIYKGKIITVKKENLLLPNGKVALREFVHHKSAVAILGIINDEVLLVKQYRTGSKSYMIEIPAGLIEEGENPIDCAVREFQEETGYMPKDIKFLGKYFLSPGYCDEVIYLYYSDNLVPSKLPQDEDEFIEIIKLRTQKIKEFIQDSINNCFMDAKTILSLSLYLNERAKK